MFDVCCSLLAVCLFVRWLLCVVVCCLLFVVCLRLFVMVFWLFVVYL